MTIRKLSLLTLRWIKNLSTAHKLGYPIHNETEMIKLINNNKNNFILENIQKDGHSKYTYQWTVEQVKYINDNSWFEWIESNQPVPFDYMLHEDFNKNYKNMFNNINNNK